MIYVVIVFLWVSVCLYLILGGADFGAGILELFSQKKNREKIKDVMGKSIAPIWEANHMWLIIAIVILFVGFPTIYTCVSTYLHIPLVLLLVGIIARGTAFTFRHYDAVDDRWQKIYTLIFQYSSFVTPFFLGIIGAASISRYIDPDAKDFLSLYIFSWFNGFGISVGFFTIAICAYLASIYALNVAKNRDDFSFFIHKVRHTSFWVVATGLLVFITAYLSNIPLLKWVFSKALGIAVIALATMCLFFINDAMKRERYILARCFAGLQIMLILIAATYQHNPDIILFANGKSLSLFDESAAEKTINALGWALLLGSVFILPFLFYLLFSFEKTTPTDDN